MNDIQPVDYEEIAAAQLIERVSFEKIVAAKVAEIRDKIKAANDRGLEGINSLDFKITAEGPIHRDNLLIKFTIGGYGNSVSSHDIDSMLMEYFRRHGFDAKHNGLLLTQFNETARS